jgi:hypothetical protein
MLLSQFFGHQKDRSTPRSRPCRRPVVEALEGRQLLSTLGVTNAIRGNHIGTDTNGHHVGYENIGIHIGSEIQGNHIGTNVVYDAVVPNGGVSRKH